MYFFYYVWELIERLCRLWNCVFVNFLKIFSLLCLAYRRGPILLTFMDWNFVCNSYITFSVFWDVTQDVLLVSYRRFGTTYRSHLQGSSRKMVARTTILRCIKSQKIAELTSYLITYLQQNQFFSWWKTNTVVNNTLSGYTAARGS